MAGGDDAAIACHVESLHRQTGQAVVFGAGSLITRTTNDVQQVQMLVLMSCTMLVTAPLREGSTVVDEFYAAPRDIPDEPGQLIRAEEFTREVPADAQGWRVELISASDSDAGGFKEVVANVAGSGVFAKLKFESGVHRVQRVPVTESGGRIHTSAATVAVLPEAEEVDIDIPAQDIRIEGGQLRIVQDGELRKFVAEVEHRTFAGRLAAPPAGLPAASPTNREIR